MAVRQSTLRFFRVCCTVLLTLASQPLLAAADRKGTDLPWYQFEIIVFERIAPGAGSTEAWPDDPGTPSRLDAIPLRIKAPGQKGAGIEPVPFATLPKSAWQLDGHERGLKRSRNYRPLLHLAWRQQMTNQQQATRLYLELPQEQRLGVGPETPPKIEGTIKIWVERYLHLQVDLLLRRLQMNAAEHGPQGGLAGLGPYYQPYRLESQRRMRSGKLHYIDHPLLGVLFLATKYELPEPEPEPEPEPVTEPAAAPPPSTIEPGTDAAKPAAAEQPDTNQ